MKIDLLKGKIVERGLNLGKTAELIGLNRAIFYRRMAKPELLTIRDAERLKNVLELTDAEAIDIFLS